MQPKPSFIGLDTQYPTVDNGLCTRVHLDGAASPLACSVAIQSIQKMLPHYSNTHSYVHSSAHITTQALNWAHQTILDFLGADKKEYTAIFTGSGTTAAINRVARGLSRSRKGRDVVLVSSMEHHANDLPHRQFENEVHYIPLIGNDDQQGAIDLNQLERLLEQHKEKVNYIAFSAVSNVTGITNSVSEISRLAHKYGALVLVDGAQAVAHMPINLSAQDTDAEPDFYVFSGHKLYTPSSPGVLVAKKTILDTLSSGQDLGGGSVSAVSYYDYQLLTQYPYREQSGTPNIVGAVALASVIKALSGYGFDRIQVHDTLIMDQLRLGLSKIENVTIYGDKEASRIGALAFNYRAIDHGLLAAILNDYYAIAVRNECFCAHPYVSSMMKSALWDVDLSDVPEDQQEAYINTKRGMVRVSVSLYNSEEDIKQLLNALDNIGNNIEELRSHYEPLEDGSYRHKTFCIDWRDFISL